MNRHNAMICPFVHLPGFMHVLFLRTCVFQQRAVIGRTQSCEGRFLRASSYTSANQRPCPSCMLALCHMQIPFVVLTHLNAVLDAACVFEGIESRPTLCGFTFFLEQELFPTSETAGYPVDFPVNFAHSLRYS